MNDVNIWALFISSIALIVAVVSLLSNTRYSRINLLHTVQDMMLTKAKDCNSIYGNIQIDLTGYDSLLKEVKLAALTSEIVISLQLLDNLIIDYKIKKKRNFFIKQYWTQLNSTIRNYLKTNNQYEFQSENQKNEIILINKELSQFYT
jgi:hypothetical protein